MARHSSLVRVGGHANGNTAAARPVLIGDGQPIVLQTMWKAALTADDLTSGLGAVLGKIEALKAIGCGLLRFAVPDLTQAERLGNLAAQASLPLVADIHFDHRLALRCLDFPIAKIRINPGNIGSRLKIKQLVNKAADCGVPIRIGVNAGSLPADLRRLTRAEPYKRAEALVIAAERELAFFDELNFKSVIVSMKASNIADTLESNRLFAGRQTAPLHLGVTEAGPLIAGVTRNAIALHRLLAEGIGDTIRVSLSDSMENEIIAGREILNALADYKRQEPVGRGISIVSCPRCGRSAFDTQAFTERWRQQLYALAKDAVVAIMGCVVNGPGEARHADLGISGAGDKVVLFRHGQIIRTVALEEADAAFGEELEKL